jgi:IS5 family transposase
MNKVVPWDVLVGVVEPHWPKSKTGRPPFAIETMLRIHYLHVWTRRLLQAPLV